MLLMNYGIQKALDMTIREFGPIDQRDTQVGYLLFMPLNEELDYSYQNYCSWLIIIRAGGGTTLDGTFVFGAIKT